MDPFFVADIFFSSSELSDADAASGTSPKIDSSIAFSTFDASSPSSSEKESSSSSDASSASSPLSSSKSKKLSGMASSWRFILGVTACGQPTTECVNPRSPTLLSLQALDLCCHLFTVIGRHGAMAMKMLMKDDDVLQRSTDRASTYMTFRASEPEPERPTHYPPPRRWSSARQDTGVY